MAFEQPGGGHLTTADAIDPIHRLEPLGVPVMQVGQILRRHAWVILLVVVVGVGGCAAVVFNMAPRYTASTSVLVEPRRTQVSDLQAISNDPENAPNMMKTQIDILRSPALAQRVVTALGLMDLAEFTGGPSLSRKLLTTAQRLLGLPGGDVVPPSENETVRKATEALLERIYFGNEPRSNVLRIFAETGDPELSAKVTNEFARQFLDFKRHQKFAATQRAHEWFQERLRELAVNVRGAEVLVQEYREKHGLTDVPTSRSFAPAGPSINS
jgi:succinoglycan biosynthesis transport protein ExoP